MDESPVVNKKKTAAKKSSTKKKTPAKTPRKTPRKSTSPKTPKITPRKVGEIDIKDTEDIITTDTATTVVEVIYSLSIYIFNYIYLVGGC